MSDNHTVLRERPDNGFRQPAPERPASRPWSGTVTFDAPVSPMQVTDDGAVVIAIDAESVTTVETGDDGSVVVRVPT